MATRKFKAIYTAFILFLMNDIEKSMERNAGIEQELTRGNVCFPKNS